MGVFATACGTTPASSTGTSANGGVVVSSSYQATAANVDPGSPLNNKPAPNFTLTNQFGQSVSLTQYRGKVVILAFLDSRCTTICPLTSEEMVMAKKMLGAKAGSQVALLAVDANPTATAVSDVYSYSQAHGVLHQWNFLTGTKAQLAHVWKQYGIYVAIQHGAIDHTPGVYILNAKGQENRLYMTQMAYGGLGQQAQLFAQAMARILPHPTTTSKAVLHRALVQESTIHTLNQAKLPLASSPGGSLTLGDGTPRLLVFTASWLTELSNVPAQMEALDQYQAYAAANHLPSLVAIDEVPTEPSPNAFRTLLKQMPTLQYPVALDKTGAVADEVGVQDITWYALVNAHGKVIWAHDGSNNWLSIPSLEQQVSRAWAKANG